MKRRGDKQIPLGGGPEFDGGTYEAAEDKARLTTQLIDVRNLMLDGAWRTLREIVEAIGHGTEASISARLRDLRKDKWGAFEVECRARGMRRHGLFEYQVRKPPVDSEGEGISRTHVCVCSSCGRKHRRKETAQGRLVS